MIEFGANRDFGDTDFSQGILGFRLTSAHGDGATTALSLKFGSAVDGVHAMRSRIDLSTTIEVFERPVTISMGLQRNEGGTFIDQSYRDESYSLSLSSEISDRLSAMISLDEVHSSEDFFDDRSIGFGVSYHF